MKNRFNTLFVILLTFAMFHWTVGISSGQTTWRSPAKPVPAGPYITGTPGALPRIPAAIVPARPIQLLDQSIDTSVFRTGGVWLESLEWIHSGGRTITGITGQGFTGVEKNMLIGSGLPALQTFSMPALQWVGGTFQLNVATLETVSLPVLKHTGGDFTVLSCNALTALSLPELESTAYRVNIQSCSALASISMPKLKSAMGVSMTSVPNVTSLSLPALQNVFSLAIYSGMSGITTIELPAIVEIGELVLTNASVSLTTVTIGSGLKGLSSSLNLSLQALNTASVDGILTRLAALDGTNGTTLYGTGKTVNLSGGTSSAPTFTGTTATSTAIVGNGTTATVTKATHGYSTGDLITISGAVNSAFNGTKQITVTGANAFTFPCTYNGTAGTQGSMKKAGSTTEGYYRKQQLELRGVTVITN